MLQSELCSQKSLYPKKTIRATFVLFVMLGHTKYYDSIVNQVSIKHLTKEKLLKVFWLRPPLPEQRAIAATSTPTPPPSTASRNHQCQMRHSRAAPDPHQRCRHRKNQVVITMSELHSTGQIHRSLVQGPVGYQEVKANTIDTSLIIEEDLETFISALPSTKNLPHAAPQVWRRPRRTPARPRRSHPGAQRQQPQHGPFLQRQQVVTLRR
jgi:hypothetical protein